jgi:hypothetical protein
MILTLEALNAQHGDALLLHYGTAAAPKLIVIDGGPPGVFEDVLLPRLEELRSSRSPGGALPIRLLMVSHIDDDHVAGVLAFAVELLRAEGDLEAPSFDVTTLWHNSFDDLVKTVKVADLHQLALGSNGVKTLDAASKAIPASVPQGRDLRNAAKKLGLNLNTGFTDLVISPTKGKKTVKLGSGLSFTVVGPRQAQVDALQNDWAKKIADLKKKGKLAPAAMEAFAADFVDRSVNNLSSIVVLAEAGERRLLLTGDARGDFVLEGLEAAGLLKSGPLHVDIFKLPHHGSIRNAKEELFEMITADHYVISANGRDGNPDTDTLKLLIESRGKDEYTIHLTNRVPKTVKFLQSAKKGKKFNVVFRESNALSVKVDLDQALTD